MQMDNPLVVDGDYRFPFSKGILSQSLMALGLPAEEAYQLAIQVQEKLNARRKATVTKEQLKEMVYKILVRDYGEELAAKYRRKPKIVPPIMVSGKKFSYPFSKGILAKSISVVGLESLSALAIAQEVENRLRNEGRTEVSRDSLREITYNLILERYGIEYARRYLLWRYIETSPKPLIVLIGGATGSGKSSVSAEIASRIGINRFISTDSIRQIMRTMVSDELLPSVHASSFKVAEHLYSVSHQEKDSFLNGFKEQARRVSVGLNALIERAIAENTPLLVEGVHILPGLIKPRFFNEAHIAIVYLIIKDRELHRSRFYGRETQSSLRRAQRYIENFERIRQIQDFIVEQAQKFGVPVINNVIYDQTVSDVIQVITEYLYRIQEEVLSVFLEEKDIIEKHFRGADE